MDHWNRGVFFPRYTTPRSQRMEPIQVFINEHPKCKGPRGKLVQSLINRHVTPRPSDPGHVAGVLCR